MRAVDLFIVHFSGHGRYDEQLYLICNGTDINNPDISAISVDSVKRILRKCKARYKLLILDCCYAGGAFSGTFKGEQEIKNTLSKALEGSASIILSACSRFEPARELASLDGGAGFLSWVLIASCTTRFHEVSLDHRSLSLADIWHWMPKVLAEVNSSLSETECLPRPILVSQLEAGTDGEIWLTEARGDTTGKSSYERQPQDRAFFLKALLADHSSFMNDRLSSFVGRAKELAETRQRITEKQQTGGYVTITGQAGQGKSSIIAKLVQEYGSENVAYHFIPFNPGPDHQVGLLHNLMARLILKYDLSDLYVASESRPALRDYLPKVLSELRAKGGREVIFIDDLDQLEAEQSGERDLSFLPTNPPVGIVFVLGTRPNDTLRPLELLKPHCEYPLPQLSREDFGMVLQHRHVHLEKGLADQFYHAMRANALYLDLVAKELAEKGAAPPEVLVKQLATNPEHLFSLSMARLKKQQPLEWREVIKPVLGVLLVAREPLGMRHIRQILGVEDDRLREGMERLGGLIVRDWQHRYSLFHLKLYEYLCQDEQHPTKEYIFATDEEESWHKRLAQWCEQGHLPIIWQDTKHDLIEQRRREYARQHYIAHVYHAHEWQRLFEVLDTVQYGQEKVRDDPSTRSYAQDVDLGRQAAAWEGWTVEEGVVLLPCLWQYTLLRCSLTSRADRYTPEAFKVLLMLKCEREALGLVELLTIPPLKAKAMLLIAEHIGMQSGREQERLQLLLRCHEIAKLIKVRETQAETLEELGITLAKAQYWGQAEVVIHSIKWRDFRARALVTLVVMLAQAQQWERAEAVARDIEWPAVKAEALRLLGMALAKAQQLEQAEIIWTETDTIIRTFEESYARAKALEALGATLAQAQEWERAEAVIRSIEQNNVKAEALRKLNNPTKLKRLTQRPVG